MQDHMIILVLLYLTYMNTRVIIFISFPSHAAADSKNNGKVGLGCKSLQGSIPVCWQQGETPLRSYLDFCRRLQILPVSATGDNLARYAAFFSFKISLLVNTAVSEYGSFVTYC